MWTGDRCLPLPPSDKSHSPQYLTHTDTHTHVLLPGRHHEELERVGAVVSVAGGAKLYLGLERSRCGSTLESVKHWPRLFLGSE